MDLTVLEAAIAEAKEREEARDRERRVELSAGFRARIMDVFGSEIASLLGMRVEIMGEATCAGVFDIEDERFHLIACDDIDQWRISRDDDRPESQPFRYRLFDTKPLWGEPGDADRRGVNLDRLLVMLGELRTTDAVDDLPF